jgi:thiol:disulfide interchange protein
MSYRAWMCILLATLSLAGCEVDVEERERAPVGAPSAALPKSGKSQPLFPTHPAVPATARAQGSLPFVKGFETGYGQAKAAGKPMLLFFTAEWCRYCHQMADEAFANPQVVELAERFVCILVDADAEAEVCKEFRVQGYPTVQFLSPRGVPLNRLVGKKPSHQVMMAMQAALQNVARKSDDNAPKPR